MGKVYQAPNCYSVFLSEFTGLKCLRTTHNSTPKVNIRRESGESDCSNHSTSQNKPRRISLISNTTIFSKKPNTHSLVKSHLKHLPSNKRETIMYTLEELHDVHTQALLSTARLCAKQPIALQERMIGIEKDILTILDLSKRHCKHGACVQKQLNLVWRKLERACLISDKFSSEIFKCFVKKYSETWKSSQATISLYFQPGQEGWYAAMEQLSALFQESIKETVASAIAEARVASKSIKNMDKALRKAQKENARNFEAKHSTVHATAVVGAEVEEKGIGARNKSISHCSSLDSANLQGLESLPEVYVVEYTPKDLGITADVIFQVIEAVAYEPPTFPVGLEIIAL